MSEEIKIGGLYQAYCEGAAVPVGVITYPDRQMYQAVLFDREGDKWVCSVVSIEAENLDPADFEELDPDHPTRLLVVALGAFGKGSGMDQEAFEPGTQRNSAKWASTPWMNAEGQIVA